MSPSKQYLIPPPHYGFRDRWYKRPEFYVPITVALFIMGGFAIYLSMLLADLKGQAATFDLKKLELWLTEVVQTIGPNLYRSKGILQIKGHAKRVVFQGVQMMFDAAPDRIWGANEKRSSQIVLLATSSIPERWPWSLGAPGNMRRSSASSRP